MFSGGVGLVEAAGEHGHGAGRQRALMRRTVDAAGEAGDDGIALAAELGGEQLRHLDAGERGVARADDGDRRQREDRGLAFDRDDRRRLVDGPKHRRIVGLADADEAGAVARRRRNLGFGFRSTRDAQAPHDAALVRQLGQRLERRLGRTEAVDQVAEGGRADILGTDEAKPGDALALGQARSGARRGVHPLAPIRVSAPARRREMLALCLTKTITLSTAKRIATSVRPKKNRAAGTATAATRAASEE